MAISPAAMSLKKKVHVMNIFHGLKGLSFWFKVRLRIINPILYFFGPVRYGFKSVWSNGKYDDEPGKRLGYLRDKLSVNKVAVNYVYYDKSGTAKAIGSHLAYIAPPKIPKYFRNWWWMFTQGDILLWYLFCLVIGAGTMVTGGGTIGFVFLAFIFIMHSLVTFAL